MFADILIDPIYRDDPTILAWILVTEPISAPFNYPVRPPDITASELRDWFQKMASRMKSLDSNHLVTIVTTAAITSLDDWLVAFDAPALEFLQRMLMLLFWDFPDTPVPSLILWNSSRLENP